MRRMTRGLVAVLESEEIAAAAAAAPAAPAVDETAAIVDHSDTVETGLMEIADSEADAASVSEQTEEAADVATALESIAVCLKAAAGNGGLSRDGAQAVNIAVSHMARRVGINPAKRSMPALESYGTTGSRVTATILAMETVADVARKVWYAIVDALKKSIAWLTERFHLFFGTAEKLKKRAEELADKAGKLGDAKASSETIDKSALVAGLHVGGKVDALPAHLADLGKGVLEVLAGSEQSLDHLNKIVDAKTPEDAKAPVAGLLEHMIKGIAVWQCAVVANPEGEGIRKPVEGVVVARSKELPGGKALIVEAANRDMTKSEEEIVKAITNTKSYMGDFSSKSKPADGTKLPVLNPADQVAVAKAVVALADAFTKINEISKKLSDGKSKLVEKAEAFVKKEAATPSVLKADAAPAGEKKEGEAAAAAPAKSAEDSQNEKVARAAVMGASRIVDASVTGLSVYVLNTGKRALDYATASYEAYGGKVEGGDKKEEKKDDKPSGDKPAGDKPADAPAAPAAA